MDDAAARLDVLPYWMQAAGDGDGPARNERARTWTRLGTIGRAAHGLIDPTGLANVVRQGPSVDWWVGAEDRWHVPGRSASVRQTLVGACPVVETRMRVPGGDIVHRAYAIQDAGPEGGRGLLVVRIENASAVPVALALAVRPYDLEHLGTARHIELDGGTVRVDGRDVVYLPKHPQGSATSNAADGDVSSVVSQGGATATSAEVTCPDGMAQAAFVFPLTHTASLTFAMPLGDGVQGGAPSAVPAPDQVVRGWVTQSDRGTRLVLPDDRLQSAVDANRRYLLSFAAGVDIRASVEDGDRAPDSLDLGAGARVIRALDDYGFHDEAAEALAPFSALRVPRRLEASQRDDFAALISALANHHDVTGPPPAEIVPNLGGTIQLVQDAGRSRLGLRDRLRAVTRAAVTTGCSDEEAVMVGFRDGARLLRAAGEDGAAATADEFADAIQTGGTEVPGAQEIFDRVDALLSEASPTWTWPRPDERSGGHSPGIAGQFLTLVRMLLVRPTGQGLAFLPVAPRRWYGRGLEVHHAPTRFGLVSYAIRWHGERPALLWEITGDAEPAGIVLTCPGLDPEWSSAEMRGETLLAAPPS